MLDFSDIINRPLLVRQLDAGSKVIRVRPHDKEGQEFKFKHEMSYPPADKTGLMRANFEKNPIFYGAIFSGNPEDKDSPRVTCLFESSRVVTDDEYVGKKDFTYSQWTNKKNLKLFVIPTFDNDENPPTDFVWYFNMWKNLIEENALTEEDVIKLKELSEKFSFIAETTEEQNECYRYTATFTQQLLEKYPEIDGILYPSARLKGSGMGINVAIRPEVIDTSFDFRRCAICRFFKRSKTHQLVLPYKRGLIVNKSTGKIRYTKVGSFFNDINYGERLHSGAEFGKLKFVY